MERIAQAHPDMDDKQALGMALLPYHHYKVWDTRRAPEPFGILAIHASAVSVNGEALIFLGPSGTGKSTMCKLLGTSAHLLADDKVYLVPRGRLGWAVADASDRIFTGPLSEEEAIAVKVPLLRGIFRLYQAPHSHLVPIGAVETCRHLTDAFFELFWHQRQGIESKKRAYAGLAAISQSIPGYHLYSNRSRQVLEVLHEKTVLQNSLKRIGAIK